MRPQRFVSSNGDAQSGGSNMKVRTIVTAATVFLAVGVAAGGLFLSGVFTSSAAQNPTISLDMNLSSLGGANTYSGPGPETVGASGNPYMVEAGNQCGYVVPFPPGFADATDNDTDGFVNDGCPTVGSAPETGVQCANNVDDDLADDQTDPNYPDPNFTAPGIINDGCPTQGTNGMTVGTIQNCLTTNPPGSAVTHTHTVQIIVQNVQDLIGWQARINYIGDQFRPSVVNYTPFTDNKTSQSISFVNLPLDGTVHRG